MIDAGLFVHATESDLTRFLANVRPEANHWMWLGCVNGSGYGIFPLCGYQIGAHRVAYEWANGPIFSWLEVDHKCRQPLCVSPAHLEVVTHLENVRRGKLGEFIRNSNHPLAKHLCDREVSITDFARSVSVSSRTIVAMMRGHRPGDPEITYRVGEAIGLSWEETDAAFPRPERRDQTADDLGNRRAILVCLLLIASVSLRTIEGVMDRWREREHVRATRNIGLRIYHGAYWFGEWPEVKAAFETLGIHLDHNGTLDFSALRDSYVRSDAPNVNVAPEIGS